MSISESGIRIACGAKQQEIKGKWKKRHMVSRQSGISRKCQYQCSVCSKDSKTQRSRQTMSYSVALPTISPIKCTTQLPLIPAKSRVVKFPELCKDGVLFTQLQVREIAKSQSRPCRLGLEEEDEYCSRMEFGSAFLADSYDRCRRICAEIPADDGGAQESNMGDLRRTDELVDGPNAKHTTADVLDRWEERLEDIFSGRPFDMLDAALAHTLQKFPLDIKPFRDMIEGMRMDTRKFRYLNFEELYLYCYCVAGTVGLMSVPVMGMGAHSLASLQRIYNAALNLGIANQLTNILRDVGEDAERGRVYLPQEELAQFGLCDDDVLSRKVVSADERWKEFMKAQIRRARFYFNEAEEGASQLDKASRWPVWSSLMLYRQILDEIENNGFDNLTRRAYVSRGKKLLMLPLAYTRSATANISN
ncbi:hypothetical protein H6P81_009585 [Aristolochia fimbriata]|uniref:15-cis-phytoene synthase n=1 Tax=Aristolochia fimbriata TaxID=158543 RepID=A0AAV7ENC9_ARIFI|nr:hypothetical protein H6P81_009585 [Aristolochia fimbriata]